MRAFQNVFFSIWNVEINKSSNFAHVTRLPSKHIRDTEKEYSRSFAYAMYLYCKYRGIKTWCACSTLHAKLLLYSFSVSWMCLLGSLVTCAKFKLLFISTFQIEKTHFEKLTHRNCTDLLREIYLLTCDQQSNQPTNQQNPEVEKLSCTMQNLSCLRELINGAVHCDYMCTVFLSLDTYSPILSLSSPREYLYWYILGIYVRIYQSNWACFHSKYTTYLYGKTLCWSYITSGYHCTYGSCQQEWFRLRVPRGWCGY